MSAGKVDVLAVMDKHLRIGCVPGKGNCEEAQAARAAVADAMSKSEAVWQILLNEIEAGNVSEGYRQHAEDCRAALARLGGVA